ARMERSAIREGRSRIALRFMRATKHCPLRRFIHWPDAATLLPFASTRPAEALENSPGGRIPSAMTVALSPARADPAQRGPPSPWLTRERLTAIRRPLTTLVVGVAAWEILARTV